MDFCCHSIEQTPIMKAVCTNQLKVVQQLVDAGADVARSDKDGNNVLHLAALNLHRPMVVYLLKHRLVLDDLGVCLLYTSPSPRD